MSEADCVRLCGKIARGCVKMNASDYEKFIRDDKEKQARIVLIRHGMTQGNKEHRYVGTTDEGLLPESVEQLHSMQEFWCKQVFMKDKTGVLCDREKSESVGKPAANPCDACAKNVADNLTVYVSPYLRAKQTADILFPGMKQVEIAEFAECRFGTFEYKNYAELNGNPDYQRYIDSGGTTAFPGGETKAEFTDRVMRGFEKVFVDVESREEQKRLRCDVSSRIEMAHTSLSDTIIIIAHGGTIMALLDQLSEPHKDYFDWQVKPGEGVAGILSVNEDRNVVITNITRQ